MASDQDDFEYYGGDGSLQVGIFAGICHGVLLIATNSQEEERVQSYTSKVEPVTGEKRLREDNDQNGIPHPSSRSTSGSGSIPNGNYTTNMATTGQVQSMSGYDALYIGDLQWVCFLIHFS